VNRAGLIGSWAAMLALTAIAFLLMNVRSIDPAAHTRVMANLHELEELDAQLDATVLKLREALLSSYDSLVETSSLIKAHLHDLEQGDYALTRLGGHELGAAMEAVAAGVERKEALIEQFKSRNAVLKNSYHYFPRAIDALAQDREAGVQLRDDAQSLLREILLLRLGATAGDYERVHLQLGRFEKREDRLASGPGAKKAVAVQHAALVLGHQAEVDRLVREVTGMGVNRTSHSLRVAYNHVFEQKLRESNLYRLVLLLLSLALFAYGGSSFLKLRHSTARLQTALHHQAREMAERAQAQIALQQSEGRYRQLFDQHPQPMWVYDPQSFAFLTVNEAALRHYGYTREEFLAMTIKDIRPAEDVASVIGRVKRLDWSGWHRVPSRHRKKDGTLTDVEIVTSEVTFAERTARLVLVEDVTEKKQAEEKLRLAALALENAAEGVMISDEHRRILSANKAFTRITGYSADEIIGRESDFLRSGEHDQAFYDALWVEVKATGAWQGEVWRRRKDGGIYPEWRSISAVRSSAGDITHFVSVFSDISQAKQTQERLHFLAHHDALTGLPNRVLFIDRVQEALSRAHRRGAVAAVLFIDLDRFKDVNDSLGHGVGDQLLQAVTARLRGSVRETDTVARLGGDEFTLLAEELAEPQHASRIAQTVLAALSQPFVLGDHEVFVSGSIGISCYPQDGNDPHALLKNADAAMYKAKEQGRNNFQFFSAEMNSRAMEKLVMTNKLRAALEREEFLLHYQPIVDLASERVNALEALVRWQHPTDGLVPPGQFIPLAEDSGLIVPIGDWVLRSACAQMKAWSDAGIAPRRIAVNLSARQFRQKDLVERIKSILRETGLRARQLELEITESMVMADPAEAEKVLQELHDAGISLAIDDFGTGYSSLSYLKRFPIDFLKIDRSFVRDIPHSNDDVAIARAIIAMAKSLGLRVIAEGVENDAQRAFLDMEGCEEIQGYLVGKPVDAGETERLLRRPTRVERALPAAR
jgi:diguanylate cyclase (GGDEF)-like protein/PAS domain S-box-containing protein